MTRNIINITAVFISCLVLICIIGGCNRDPVVDGTNTPQSSVINPPSSVDVILDGKPQVRIVRGDNASEAETDAAIKIRKAIGALCSGSAPDITTDFSKDGTHDSSIPEILVGRTEYQESIDTLNSISYGEYAIRITGNKVVVTAWSDAAMNVLAENFINLLGKYSSDSLTLTDKDSLVGIYNEYIQKLPAFNDAESIEIINGGDLAYQIVIPKTNKDMYNKYLSKLESSGFVNHSERSAAGNLFSIFTDSLYAINVYFTPTSATTRIIIEPLSNLCLQSDESYNTLTSPKLVMIGRNFGNGKDNPETLDASSGLMCFVIQLSDGRYIVIDGGVATDSFAQGIYYALLQNATDKDNITIAAWIITHSHTDHIGGFCRFSELYSSKVSIERFIYNFPSEAAAKSFGEDTNIQRVSRNISSYYPESKINKAHTGQIYRIADAQIEVYYTVDDYAGPGRTLQSTTNYNLSSLIFSVTIAGQKIMFLGDAQNDSNNMTALMYGDYLKSDFVQVAHHGGAGGTDSIYKAVDPIIALFTTSDALLPVYLKYSYNDYLINSLNVKEYYNSADRIKTWNLPYQPNMSGFIKD